MKKNSFNLKIGNKSIGITLTKGNLRDFEKIERSVSMKDIYSCFFCCSNDAVKVPGHEHRHKRDNIREFVLKGGDASVLYPSSTYGVKPNEHCLYYLKKHGLGSYNGWFNVFVLLYERNKKELKEWLEDQKEN